MTNITIPPEALEAAAKELYEVDTYTDDDDDDIPWEELHMIDKEEYLDYARSACLAMLKAWPGMQHCRWNELNAAFSSHLILPLPKENING